MKKAFLALIFSCTSYFATAQSGYEIKVNLSNCKDTLAYLTYYQFDKTFIKDTCQIQNGKIVFKGKDKLDKGIYSLVSQEKRLMFDFFIDEDTQNLELKTESGENVFKNLYALNSERENNFFKYVKFISEESYKFSELKKNTPLKTKKDTLDFTKKQRELELMIHNYELDFIAQNKNTFIADMVNLKMEKLLRYETKSTKKPDIKEEFKYYKKHYWDRVNFGDDGTMRNPFFHNKLKKYFDNVVTMHPDSVSVEIDNMLSKTKPESSLYKTLLAHFTYTYETSDIMGFDKVFVHMSDAYFKTGKANGVYSEEETVQKIIKKADKLKPLLVGEIAPDLFMIKANDFDKMKAMGFENAKNSEEMTKVFYEHINDVQKMFVKLSEVKADFTIMIFWDVDCGHCQKEIPKLLDLYNELIKDKKDVKVFSVYMQHEGEKYLKYIAEHKLPWINVYDGAHYNNTQEKYDVYSTPVIYLLNKNKVIKAKRIVVDDIKNFIKIIEQENKISK